MYLRHMTKRNALSDNGMIDVASKNATILHIRIFANKDSTTIISIHRFVNLKPVRMKLPNQIILWMPKMRCILILVGSQDGSVPY
jgi:hypothetical protein